MVSTSDPTLPDPGNTDPRLPLLGGDTTAKRRPPRRPRGLLDFVLACLLIYGVYAKTPIGALAEWGVRTWVFDQEHTPSLSSSFRGRDADVELNLDHLQKGVLASLSFPPSIEDAAKRSQVDPELLAVLVASHGRCDGDSCFVTTPPHLDELLERPVEEEEVPVLFVALGLAQGAKRLNGTHELAVEALFLPPHAVERAIGQAQASGLPNPNDVEAHASFFAPSLRRGALPNAVSVLALHRLRTLMWPTPEGAPTTSPYGYRIHPITKQRKFHNGTDVGVRTGTPLKSAHKGHVKRAGQDSISGKYVHLAHGFGIVSTHCHMSEVRVQKDDPLARGQVVGLSGATGRVTGPHLHYILRIDGKTVDPEAYGNAPGRHLATDEASLPQAGLPPPEPEQPTPKAPKKRKKAKRPKPRPKAPPSSPPPSSTPAKAPAMQKDAGPPEAEPPAAADEPPAPEPSAKGDEAESAPGAGGPPAGAQPAAANPPAGPPPEAAPAVQGAAPGAAPPSDPAAGNSPSTSP